MPSQASSDDEERGLRRRVDNASRRIPRFSPEQMDALAALKAEYGREQVDWEGEIAYLERYCAEHGRMPSTVDPDTRVSRCAERIAHATRLEAGLHGRLVACRKAYGRYRYSDPAEFVADYVSFIGKEGRIPCRDAESLRERRLAVDLGRLRQELTDGQQLAIETARDSVRRAGSVSYSEKLLAAAIAAAVAPAGGRVVGLNRPVAGREADILVEDAGGRRVAIQYDGGVHAGAGKLESDLAADAAMAAEGVPAFRVREPGAAEYPEGEAARVVRIERPLGSMGSGALAETLAAVMSAAGLDGDVAAVDWAAARAAASSASSARTTVASSAARYAELLLLGKGRRPAGEMQRVKNRLRGACRRGTVPDDALRLLAWLEANLDDGRSPHFFGDAARDAGIEPVRAGAGGMRGGAAGKEAV